MERQMRYAYEIYKQKSFSKAAETLYISQPALSAIIRKLEETLGTAIFDRSTKPVSLTAEGEFYMHCAEQIMNIETGMEQYFEDIAAMRRGKIRIGASTYFCSSVLPDLLKSFREQYPYITCTLEENSSTPLLKEHLLSKEIDFAISSNNYPEDEYDSIVLDEEAIILAVPSSFEINQKLKDQSHTYDEIQTIIRNNSWHEPDRRTVSVSEFADLDIITIDKNSDLFPRIVSMFKADSLTPSIIMHLSQMSSCYYMAANGFGCAFLRSSTLHTVKDTGSLCFYLPKSPLAFRKSYLYYKKGAYISKSMQAFIDYIHSEKDQK